MTCRVAGRTGGYELDPENWWGAVDGEILDALAGRGAMSLTALCEQIGASEGEMIGFVAMLAREGRIRICQIERAA
jgi:hypothetical protein